MKHNIRMKGLLGVGVVAGLLLGFSPAAGASVTVPAVVKFTVSKSALPTAGGSITVKASVIGGSTKCTLAATPKLSGFSGTIDCAKSFTEKVTVPADTTGNTIVYALSFQVKNSAGSAQSSSLEVTVAPAPAPISTNPQTITFGSEGVYIQTPPLQVTVRNNSSVTQNIGSASIVQNTGNFNDFAVNDNSCSTLTSGQTCSFYVTFTPQGSGARTATLAIYDASWGAYGAYATSTAEGTGVFSEVSEAGIGLNTSTTPPTYTFSPGQGVDTASPSETIQITDTSDVVPLAIRSIQTGGNNSTDFPVGYGNCWNGSSTTIISPGESCSFTVAFEPSGEGARNTDVVLFDNATNFETEIQLDGTGVFASASLTFNQGTVSPSGNETSPIDYSFPDTVQSDVQTTTVTITNTSDTNLDFGGAQIYGADPNDFSAAAGPDCLGTDQLLPGDSCTFTISFRSPNVGSYQAYLLINDNSLAANERINMSANATSSG